MMVQCRSCVYYDSLGDDYKEERGECTNKEVWSCHELSLVNSGGFSGNGDYFHVHGNFGCIKGKEIIPVRELNQ